MTNSESTLGLRVEGEPPKGLERQALALGLKTTAAPDAHLVWVDLSADLQSAERILLDHHRSKPAGVRVIAGRAEQCARAIELINRELVDLVWFGDEKDVTLKSVLMRARDLVRQREEDQEAESRDEVSGRVAHLRDLLRFMQKVANVESPEELLRLLRRELKSYRRISDPILAFQLGSGDRRLIHFRRDQVLRKRAIHPWAQSLRIRRSEEVDSQYLADEFGRPVQRVLAIPLAARKMEPDLPSPMLFIEHQMSAKEITDLIDHLGDRLQVISVALDRLLLEVDLRSATYLWEHTFDGFEDPVAIVDSGYHVLRSNKSFQHGRGASHCYRIFAQADGPCQGCPLQTAVENGSPERGLVRRLGEMYAVHSYPILLGRKDRSPTVVHHYTNVSEALLLQERVVQTEKMAALGHLAGHIAHELNNPLTGIRGLAQVWLSQLAKDSRVYADFKEVEQAAARSQAIIANLREFAGGEGDQDQVIDLNETVSRTLPLLKTALSDHQVEVVLSPKPARARANAHMIQQVLFNLIKNACQAMAAKGAVFIGVEENPRGPGWQITVRDTGPGIAPHLRETIFNPFVTTKPEGEGTGLGLSLSRGLVRRFGGDITVESSPGQGACFRVILPGEDRP